MTLPVNSEPKTVNRSRVFGIVAAVLLVVGLWPVRYLASPRWEVWVVTEDGQPLPGEVVRLSYTNYSVELSGHEITLQTDSDGRVLFLPQCRRVSLLHRVFWTASEATGGVHASYGGHLGVFIFGSEGYEGSAVTGKYLTDSRGQPDSMQSRIVAKKNG